MPPIRQSPGPARPTRDTGADLGQQQRQRRQVTRSRKARQIDGAGLCPTITVSDRYGHRVFAIGYCRPRIARVTPQRAARQRRTRKQRTARVTAGRKAPDDPDPARPR